MVNDYNSLSYELDLPFNSNISELMRAVKNNDLETIRKQVEKNHWKLEKINNYRLTPLMLACTGRFCDNDAIKLLLNVWGPDINMQNDFGATVLHIATFFLRYTKKSTNMNIPDIETIKLLFKNGADPNINDFFKKSPIFYLIKNMVYLEHDVFIEILKIFLEYGADLDIKCKSNPLIFYIFKKFNIIKSKDPPYLFFNPATVKKYKRETIEIMGLLLNYGINIYAKNFKFETIFDNAKNDSYMIKYILDHQYEKEKEELKKRIRELEIENERLRFVPGNSGYFDTISNLNKLANRLTEQKK